MQFIKNHFYKLTTLIAIVVLAVSQSQFYVKAQESENKNLFTISEETNSNEEILLEDFTPSGVVHAQPHANCYQEAYTAPRSTTYNAVPEYGITFVPTETGGPRSAQSYFQDINGDNLPDYVYAYNYMFVNSSTLMSTHTSCVYLHNGSGWDKVYSCYARTDTAMSTGNVVLAEYGGDCAG